jgi:hypothetical protein
MENKEDPLDEIFTKNITIKEFKELGNQINEYRRLYVEAVLVREKQIIKIIKEREELLDLTVELNKRLDELQNESEGEDGN